MRKMNFISIARTFFLTGTMSNVQNADLESAQIALRQCPISLRGGVLIVTSELNRKAVNPQPPLTFIRQELSRNLPSQPINHYHRSPLWGIMDYHEGLNIDFRNSIGRGKKVVVFCSPEISTIVWR
jgi:hypothetical protein